MILMMKTRTEVSFLSDPHLGIFLVHANRRLTHEFDFFGMELCDEHEFLQGSLAIRLLLMIHVDCLTLVASI